MFAGLHRRILWPGADSAFESSSRLTVAIVLGVNPINSFDSPSIGRGSGCWPPRMRTS